MPESTNFDSNVYCDFNGASAKAVAGKDILLCVFNAVGDKLMAISGQQGLTLTRSSETIEVTSKDSQGWKTSLAGLKEWSIDNEGLYVLSEETHFYKKITEIPVELAVYSDSKEEYVRAINHFFEVVEYDVANRVPGKLYCNGNCYLNCYILGSEKQYWKKGIRLNWYTLTLVVENPNWILESKKSYEISFEKAGGGMDYPFGYSYDFSSKVMSDTLENKEHLDVITNNNGGGKAHSHGNTGNSSPGTSSQLSSAQFSMPPYITCFIWKRIA